MKSESSANCDRLIAQHTRICFVYTFLCSRVNMNEAFADRNRETRFERFLEHQCSYATARVHWAGEPVGAGYREDERQVSYLDPFLHLKIPHVHLSLPERKVRLAPADADQLARQLSSATARLSGNIIVMDCGWGRAFYTMDIRAGNGVGFSKETIIELSNLGLRREQSFSLRKRDDGICGVRLVARGGDEVLLFSLFWRDTSLAIKAINKGLTDAGVFQRLTWVEVKEDLVGRAKSVNSTSKAPLTHFQNPFPIIILEIPPPQYALAFLPDDQAAMLLNDLYSRKGHAQHLAETSRERLVRDMLSVLFRSREWHFPDLTFARACGAMDGEALINMCSTSRIFFHLYSRSCLVVSPHLGINARGNVAAEPASYLLPMLLSTVSSLRCRWHACVTMGKWLDKLIESMTEPTADLKACLQEMISIRTEISRMLVDPITYRAGSGSLSKLYEIGLSIFRIRDLERIVMDKLSVIDTLYLDLHESRRIQEFEALGKTTKANT